MSADAETPEPQCDVTGWRSMNDATVSQAPRR